jgi:AcrR family transcriptional regulator
MDESTRSRIVNGALKIVRDQGITKLTIADVAQEAGVSKGGLLYHFPSKDELIFGVLRDTIEQHLIEIAELQAKDPEPIGSWLRAFLDHAFPPPNQQRVDIVSALFSTLLMNDRKIGKKMRAAYQSNTVKLTELMASDGLDELSAAVIQMAIDGLLFNEAAGARPFPPDQRARFVNRLREMTYTAVARPTDARALTDVVAG